MKKKGEGDGFIILLIGIFVVVPCFNAMFGSSDEDKKSEKAVSVKVESKPSKPEKPEKPKKAIKYKTKNQKNCEHSFGAWDTSKENYEKICDICGKKEVVTNAF